MPTLPSDWVDLETVQLIQTAHQGENNETAESEHYLILGNCYETFRCDQGIVVMLFFFNFILFLNFT